MHRDDSYLRDLLMEIEDSPDIVFITRRPLSASTELKKQNHHLELLCDCGFLARVNDNAYRLTSAGHDFTQAVRDETIWTKTKGKVAEAGGYVTLEILSSIAVGYLKQEISKATGITL
jgi:hypothetical protein